MHDVSEDEFQKGELWPEEQVKRTILYNGCEGRKVYLVVVVRVYVCLSASAVTEGGDVGGLAPSLLCAGPFSSAACKNSRYKPRCVLPPSMCCSNLTSRRGADGTRAWLRGFDSKLSGPKGNGDTLQLVSTTWDCVAYWPAASAGPLDLEFGCRGLGIAPSLPISPAANGVLRVVAWSAYTGTKGQRGRTGMLWPHVSRPTRPHPRHPRVHGRTSVVLTAAVPSSPSRPPCRPPCHPKKSLRESLLLAGPRSASTP